MITLESILQERYVNLFPKDIEKRKQYAQEVFDLLQASYAKIGGIKGNGFNSPQDMIDNIDMWKLVIRDGKVKAVSMYKGREGRKRVASGTDRTKEGIREFIKMSADELITGRAYAEISVNIVSFLKDFVDSNIEKYFIPVETAQKLLGKEIEPIDNFWYNRIIGGKKTPKIMIGNPKAPKLEGI